MFKIFELTLIIVYSVGIVRAAVLSSQSVTPTTITTPKAAHQQHQRKISLNEPPLYQYSSKQDPETAEFLRNVEEKFFTSSSNSNKSSTRSLQKRDTNYQDQCENPDQEYLEDLLSEYQIHYRKFEETYKNLVKEFINSLERNKDKNDLIKLNTKLMDLRKTTKTIGLKCELIEDSGFYNARTAHGQFQNLF